MKKRGFTLAEVLITLGIIGVVAAMTIPTLITNYQKRVYVVKLQKAMSVLNNGFKLMMAEEGVEYFDHLSLSTCRDEGLNVIGADETERACIHEKMSKYFKIIDYNKDSDYEDETFYPFKSLKTLSGESTNALFGMFAVAAYYYSFVTTDNILYQPFSITWSVIDVNGKDGPNQLGRDLFMITHDDRGHFTFQGTNGGWETESSVQYCDDALTGDGQGCGARIQAEGWKMNY